MQTSYRDGHREFDGLYMIGAEGQSRSWLAGMPSPHRLLGRTLAESMLWMKNCPHGPSRPARELMPLEANRTYHARRNPEIVDMERRFVERNRRA